MFLARPRLSGRTCCNPFLWLSYIVGYVFAIRSERLLCREVQIRQLLKRRQRKWQRTDQGSDNLHAKHHRSCPIFQAAGPQSVESITARAHASIREIPRDAWMSLFPDNDRVINFTFNLDGCDLLVT